MASISTFGLPYLSLPDRTVGPGKAVALLTYLTVSPGRTGGRKDLFRLLYSDDTPRDADAFRQLLASLRRTLPGVFVTNGDCIHLTSELESDRRQFLNAVQRGDDDLAVSLYTREFFEDFDERGCEGFLRWAAEEGLRLRRKFEIAAESVVREHLQQADWTTAFDVARHIAERFPALALSTRLLVETLTLAGRFGEIRSVLSELQISRVAATPAQARRLDRLLDDIERVASDNALADPRRPLVSRTREYRALLDAWSAARAGCGSVLAIGGERGMGRTRLLTNIALRLRLDTPSLIRITLTADDAHARATLVQRLATTILALPGALGASPPDYVALTALCESAQSEPAVDAALGVRNAVDALVAGLRAAGDEAPVAILLDDAQHADTRSMETVLGLIPRLHATRALIVISADNAFTNRLGIPARQRVVLGVLDQISVRQLCDAAGILAESGASEILHQQSDGVPARLTRLIAQVAARTNPAASHDATVGRDYVAPSKTALQRPLWRARTVQSLSAAAVVALVATFMMRSPELTRVRVVETLAVQSWTADSLRTRLIEVGDGAKDSPTPLFAEKNTVKHWPFRRAPERVSMSPDGRAMAVQLETDGANTMDIVGLQGDSVLALAIGPRDDAMPAWSPDGSLLAFSTDRWSNAGNEGCDIAVRDVHRADVWRVTQGLDCDLAPAWSPSGARLAFYRIARARSDVVTLCTIADLSALERCISLDSTYAITDVIGWRTESGVIVTASRHGSAGIYEVNIATGEIRAILTTLTLVEAAISPSRKFLACWCSETREQAESITLVDLADHSRPLRIDAPPSSPVRHLAWFSSVSAVLPDSSGLRTALAARSARQNADAGAAPMRALAASPGRVALSATPYTDPRASLARLVHVSLEHVALDERWQKLDRKLWVSFGDPRPSASTARGGLDPAGDGSYPSGLYSRNSFEVDSGITVEAVVRVPISSPKWQEIGIYLESDEFTIDISGWNHRTGTWPSASPYLFFETGFKYPAGEGESRASTLAVARLGSANVLAVNPSFGDGHDALVVMALLPDSTFTVTADGVVIAHDRYVPPPSRRYHLFIMGHTVDTDVRVRALRVWEHGALDAPRTTTSPPPPRPKH